MPIYEYACENCHVKEEIIQKFNDPAPEECPKCHKLGTLKKVVTTSSFHLKGGGWYKDLYSSTKPADTSSPSTKTTPDADSKKDSNVTKPSKKND